MERTMRTIKFRGKSHNGEWVYGYLYELPLDSGNVCMILTTDNMHEDNSLKPQYHLAFTIRKDLFVVNPSTIGQFTGLLDKNGKEIYEGDIIKMSTVTHGDEIFRIGYEDSHIGAFCLCSNEDTSRFVGIFGRDFGYEPFYCEVIGNIHDNPELMKA